MSNYIFRIIFEHGKGSLFVSELRSWNCGKHSARNLLLWISAQNHIHPAPGTNLSTTTNAWDLSMDATRHKERWRTSLIWICIEMHESSPMIRRQGNSCQRVLFSRGRVVFSISRCLFTIIDSLVNLFYPLRAAVFSLCNNQNRVNY